jgi:hypothetical protein
VGRPKFYITQKEYNEVDNIIEHLEALISNHHNITYKLSFKERKAETSMVYHLLAKVRALLSNENILSAVNISSEGDGSEQVIEFTYNLINRFFFTNELAFVRDSIFSFAMIGGTLFKKAAVVELKDWKIFARTQRLQERRIVETKDLLSDKKIEYPL